MGKIILLLLAISGLAFATCTSPCIVSAVAGCNNFGGCTATTSSVNTTGATLITVALSVFNQVCFGNTTVTDNKSNTYTRQTANPQSGVASSCIYRCNPCTVGTGHTISASGSAVGLMMVAFSSTRLTPDPLDQQASASSVGNATTLQQGNITPTATNEILLSVIANCSAAFDGNLGINSSYTFVGINNSGAGCQIGTAYIQETNIVAKNPTWTDSTLGATTLVSVGASYFATSANRHKVASN